MLNHGSTFVAHTGRAPRVKSQRVNKEQHTPRPSSLTINASVSFESWKSLPGRDVGVEEAEFYPDGRLGIKGLPRITKII